jgi:hypothetical protein
MFGSLFGVRNEDAFTPAYPNRGLPADESDDVHGDELRAGGGLVAPTWMLWSEIQAINWTEEGKKAIRYTVDWEHDEGRDPAYVYTEWSDEGERWHIRRRRTSVPGAEWEDYYREKEKDFGVYWEATRTRKSVLTAGWTLLFKIMALLAERYGDDKVRLVAWFDSW